MRRTDSPLSPLAERIRKNLFPILWHSRKGGFPLLPQRDFSIPTDHHMFKYILNRLTERSTWLGLLALGHSLRSHYRTSSCRPDYRRRHGGGSLIGIVTKDRKKEQENHDMADSISDLQKDTFYGKGSCAWPGTITEPLTAFPVTARGTERNAGARTPTGTKWRSDALTNAPNGTSPPFFRKRKKPPGSGSNWPGMKPPTRDMKQKLSAERARMPNRMTSTGNA